MKKTSKIFAVAVVSILLLVSTGTIGVLAAVSSSEDGDTCGPTLPAGRVYLGDNSASVVDANPVIVTAPTDVTLHMYESDTEIRVFNEKQNCDVTSLGIDGGIYTGRVDSHLIHQEPTPDDASNPMRGRGCISFATNIIGVITSDSLLDASDSVLGLATVTYPTGLALRALEQGSGRNYQDVIEFDGNTIKVDLQSAEIMDQIRVLTEPVNPSLEITKEADRENAYEGDTINYLYRVHNDGNVPLGPVVVTDSLPITPTPLLPDGVHNRGDLNQNSKLDPCETWYFTASYTVPDPCARTVIPNTGTAVAGTGLEAPTRVSAESNLVEVTILHPCIELEKWTTEEPPAYYNGTEITYYYGLHNCGDTPLEILVVRDTTLGQDATPVLGRDGTHNRGDLNNNGIFEPCETWYFSLDHTLACRTVTYSDFCNTAMAGAFEPILESRVVVGDVTWKVRIFQWLPRTIGFWGNWDNHLTDREMWNLVHDVQDQSSYFGDRLTKDLVHDFLLGKPPKFKGDPEGKARYLLAKQLLAAWLSVKSYEAWVDAGKLYGSPDWAMNPDATVYIDGTADGTVIGLLHRIEGAIGTMDKDGLLLAKDILEAMNSAESNHYLMFMDPSFDPTSPCPRPS